MPWCCGLNGIAPDASCRSSLVAGRQSQRPPCPAHRWLPRSRGMAVAGARLAGATVLLLCLALVSHASDVPAGWRMRDRFGGFRFECRGAFDRDAWALQVRDYADELSGFGWVQLSPVGTVVGEFRGTKQTAPWMREFLEAGPDESAAFACAVEEYPDTKIRFHFSHFKVMDPRRRSCFRKPPHACGPIDAAAAEASAGAREEL